MKIYTKRGDDGLTDLFGGERVKKNHPRVNAYAAVDKTNSYLGFMLCVPHIDDNVRQEIIYLMKLLFSAGAELSTAPKDSAIEILNRHLDHRIEEKDITLLEENIDRMEAMLPPLKSFILPSGSEAAARTHLARVAAREVEGLLLLIPDYEKSVRKEMLKFFNRLSDYLFVLARFLNHQAHAQEIPWSGQH